MLPLELNPPLRLLAAFQAAFPGQTPEILFPLTDRAVWIAARLSSADDRHTLANADADTTPITFTRQTAKQKRTIAGRPLPRWARFPAGVVMALAAINLDAHGIEAVVCIDEPPGPRYEYALCLAFAALWAELAEHPLSAAGQRQIADAVLREYVE